MKYLLPIVLLVLPLASLAQRKKPAAASAPRPFPLGEVHTLHSALLGEDRTLNVYLPEGYRHGDTARYPVIYLLDGSADEDFIHVAGLVQFNTFSWVARMPRSIVVGIANVDRRRDFTFKSTVAEDRRLLPTGGHSDTFIAFLEQELQPFIKKQFRTDENRMLVGQSAGGLLATEILFRKPALFNRYVIISPSLWWDGGSLLHTAPSALADSTGAPVAVYIAVGKEGLTPTSPPRVMEVDANLLADKLRQLPGKRVSLHFDYLPEENHGTISHVAMMRGFQWLYARAGKQASD